MTLICTRRVCLFGEINDGEMVTSDLGKLVENCWLEIPNHFESAHLDEHVLMPNHLHGIIFINESNGKGEAFAEVNSELDYFMSANASPLQQLGTKSGSLGAIIQNFKSVSTRMVNKLYFKPGKNLWQRNYFERIIRNDRELNAIRQYIPDNPLNWDLDEENPTKFDR